MGARFPDSSHYGQLTFLTQDTTTGHHLKVQGEQRSTRQRLSRGFLTAEIFRSSPAFRTGQAGGRCLLPVITAIFLTSALPKLQVSLLCVGLCLAWSEPLKGPGNHCCGLTGENLGQGGENACFRKGRGHSSK